MKPTIPIVPLSVWKDIYAATDRYNGARPWEVFGDRDVFGVRDPVTGEIAFGTFMGSAGILYGFCLYRGPNGYDIYQRTVNGTIDKDDFFAVQNCLKLELGPRSDMRPEDLNVIKKLFLTFKGDAAWPEFRSLLPGCAPWFLTEPEARFFAIALDVACLHMVNIVQGEIKPSGTPGTCFVYSPSDDTLTNVRGQWEPLPKPVPEPIQLVFLDPSRIRALRAKKTMPDSPWEVDATWMPGETMDRERPYFSRMAIACQQSTGFVFAFEIGPPESSPMQLLADVICSSIEKHGFLPDIIFVKSEAEVASLAPLGAQLGFFVKRKANLESIRMMKETMMKEMASGRGRTVH